MAGTITETHYARGHIHHLSFACIADAGDASFPATTVATKFEGRLVKLVTMPGDTVPTDNFDVLLYDQSGHDVLEGVGMNRDADAESEQVVIVSVGTEVALRVDESDTLALVVTGNTVPGAMVEVNLYYTSR